MIAKALRLFAGVGLAAAALALLVDGVARLTWRLSGAGTVSLESLAKIRPPNRHPAGDTPVHSVREWPPGTGRRFRQAPMLDGVSGLPPVADRLPENPLVIVPPDPQQTGPYGGTWRRLGTSSPDIGIFEARLAYEGLLRWDAYGRKILPNLAWKWTVADDARTFTFHLRRGVKWSDGAPFTADDILFWYEDVLKNPELTPVVPSEMTSGGQVVRLDKLDDFTVRFRFRRTKGLFLQKMASEWSYVILRYPRHYLRQFHPRYTDPAKLARLARAEGADFWYQLFANKVDWRNKDMPRLWAWVVMKPPPSRPIVFERNPYYWKVDPRGHQLPYIDRVTFEVFEAETINLKAINGDLGMQSRHLDMQNYSLFMDGRRKGNYRVLHWITAGGSMQQLAPNLNHKDPVLREILQKREFRIALSHAIDRDEINEASYLGMGVGRQLCPPRASPYYDPLLEKAHTRYDPGYANELLDSIGLDKRNDSAIRLMPDGRPLVLRIETTSMAGNVRSLELVADYWRKVGIQADLKIEARQLFYTRKAALMHDVGVWGSADEQNPLLDPRWFLPFSQESIQAIGYARWYASGDKSGIEPHGDIRECIALYRRIESTADETEQKRLFQRILDLNRENLWVLGTIGEVPTIVLVDNRFRNVPQAAIAGWVFRTPGNTAPECYAMVARE